MFSTNVFILYSNIYLVFPFIVIVLVSIHFYSCLKQLQRNLISPHGINNVFLILMPFENGNIKNVMHAVSIVMSEVRTFMQSLWQGSSLCDSCIMTIILEKKKFGEPTTLKLCIKVELCVVVLFSAVLQTAHLHWSVNDLLLCNMH